MMQNILETVHKTWSRQVISQISYPTNWTPVIFPTQLISNQLWNEVPHPYFDDNNDYAMTSDGLPTSTGHSCRFPINLHENESTKLLLPRSEVRSAIVSVHGMIAEQTS